MKGNMGRWARIAILCLAGVTSAAMADTLDAQRQRYQQVKQAWDSNQMDTVQALMPTLRDYPLYPYLEYRALTQSLGQVSSSDVSAFSARYPTLPPARNLKSLFVNELARREDWAGLLAFAPTSPKPVAAHCNHLYARWATGQRQGVWDEAKAIWLTGRSLPTTCDKLFAVWEDAGEKTPIAVLERIRLAMNEGSTGLVNYLVKQLPPDYRTISDALMKLQNDPKTVERFARSVGPTDFTRNATLVAFRQLARQDEESARALISTLVRLQKMSEADRREMEEAVAWRWMGTGATPEQAAWRDAVAQRSQSTSLIERRVRMTLGEGDKAGLRFWLAKLPAEALQKEEWRYWQAMLLLDNGQRQDGEAILRQLMQARGFYPMVAAQKLGIPYSLTIASSTPDKTLAQRPEIARVRELMYWNMDNLARSEWGELVANSDKPRQGALARYALDQGWADLSVQATIVAKLWDNLEERFPLAWRDTFQRMTQGRAIQQSYAMAIARQESAWNPQARSPVGASGLMQLMPATAQHTAKKGNLNGYVNSSQLFDPETNILLGTTYLDDVYQTFNNNRILASAAYNAGPSRVNTWLKNSAGRIDPVAFIESIPFTETRGYVKNVLAYDAFYRYFLHQNDSVLTSAEWGQRY